jgi:hypothetical protein
MIDDSAWDRSGAPSEIPYRRNLRPSNAVALINRTDVV